MKSFTTFEEAAAEKQMPAGSIKKFPLKPPHVHRLCNTASDTPLKRPENLRPSPGVRKGRSQKGGQEESVWKKHKAKLRGRSNRREERKRGTRNKAQDDGGRQEVFLTWAPSNVVSVCENEDQIQRERKHLKK